MSNRKKKLLKLLSKSVIKQISILLHSKFVFIIYLLIIKYDVIDYI